MSKSRLSTLIRVTALGLLLLPSQRAAAAEPGAPIVIGLIEPYTGEESSYGQWTDDAWTLAMEERGSSIHGHPIKLIRADSKCEPSFAVSAARQVLAEHPVMLMAPVCSGDTLAIAPLIRSNKLPTLSDNIAPKVTQEGGGWIWRVQITDSAVTVPEAKYIIDKKYKHIGVIHDTSAPGQANGQNMIDGLTASGNPPAASTTYSESDVDYSGPLLKLKSTELDALYMQGYEVQAARLLTQARQLGFTMPIYGNFSMFNDTFVKAAGPVANGLLGVTTYVPNWSDAASKFDAKWFQKFHYRSNADIAALYEMAIAALTALDKAPDATGQALNDVIAKTSIPDLPMGALSFDSSGNNANPLVLLVTWENQQIKILQVLTGHL